MAVPSGIHFSLGLKLHASAAIAITYTPVVDVVQATPNFGNPALEAMLAAAKPAASICITSYT